MLCINVVKEDTMYFNNIKTVIIDYKILGNFENAKDFVDELKSNNTKVVLCYENEILNDYNNVFDDVIKKDNYKNIEEKVHTPLFHCAVLESTVEGIEAALCQGLKTVGVGNSDLKTMAVPYAESLEDINVKTFLESGKLQPYEVDPWKIIENDIDICDYGHIASMFALGNGYLGLRGSYDEYDEKISDESGMYINGIFESEPLNHLWEFKGYAQNEQYTVNLPDWRIFEVYVDGEKACFSNSGMSNHRRELDMYTGKIIRSFDYTFSNGKQIHVKSIRILNMDNVHSAQIKFEVTSVNFDGTVVVKSRVIKNKLINGKNVTFVTDEENLDNGVLLLVQTKNTAMQVACAVRHKITNAAEITVSNDEEEWCSKYTYSLNRNQTVSIEKFASFYSSVDSEADIVSKAKKENADILNCGFSVLSKNQEDFWKEYWINGDVVVEGCDKDQQAIRFSLFHLRQQLPTVNDMSIGATGLTGANYSGKVFWDTEMYLMPYYNYTYPETCKGLLMYRYKILDKARERAKQLDGEGALYSWCSIDGEETSVVFEASTAEYHINSAIAYAIWRYYELTGDREFIYDFCAEILFETAKFYAHRGQFIPERDNKFCINVVCGPDEYACGVNNNCYTNFMVQFHLRFALGIYEEMLRNDSNKLKALLNKTKIDNFELELWKKAADQMYFYKDENDVYAQDDTFFYKDSVDMSMIPKNYDIRSMLHPLNLWRIKVLKQADVVLLNFVQGDKFTVEEKKANYDYYEPITNHGSSLSAAIHSIMANEIGYYDDAYNYFRSSAYMDISDFKKNTDSGLHIACLGGVWMSVVHGFFGMRLYPTTGLQFETHLPQKWKKCSFRINYKGSLMEIYATKEKTEFTLISGNGLEFMANGQLISLDNKKLVEVHNEVKQG